MKYLLLVCTVAIVASSALPRRLGRHRAAPRQQTFTVRNLRSTDFPARTLPSQIAVAPSLFSQDTEKVTDETPSFQNPYSIEPYHHQKAFLGPSVTKLFGNAKLDRSEVVVIVGSGLAALMKASLDNTYSSGMQEFKEVSLAMVAASRHVLETRVANGKHVSEEEFENLRSVEKRLSAVLETIAATFDGNADTVYSLPNFFQEFDFDPVERSKLIARVVPTISTAVFQATETSTAENFRDAYNVFLPAVREIVEDRLANNKPVTEKQIADLERAEKLMPPLMQAFVTVVHDQFLVDFMNRLELDPTERAKYLVSGFFASMDAIFKDPDASVAEMMRDTTLAFMPPSRQVFEDRLAQGKPVTQENFDNLERMEKTLPIILDAYVKVVDDLGIP